MDEQEFIKQASKAIKNGLKGQTEFVHGIDIQNPEHLICESPIEQLR
jgi:hypothetical protein